MDAGSACIVAIDVPGSQSAQPDVEGVRESGAPVVLACRQNRLEWWRQGTGPDTTKIVRTVPAEHVESFLSKEGPRLGPRSVTRAKTIARVDRSYQLDFVDFGLLPLLEEQAGEKLTDLVEDVLGELRQACGKSPDDRVLFRWVFRLLAGKLLHDKQVPSFAPLDLGDPQAVFTAVATHLASAMDRAPVREPGASALAQAAARLARFPQLAYITTHTLAQLYETGLLNKKKKQNELRKKWGIHNTPWWLAEYVVWKAKDWIAKWPLGGRRVVDPGCGAASLLVSAIGLLRELAADEGLTGDSLARYLRGAIEGFDRDEFGLEIAKLSLTLADLPHPNGWQIDTGDMFAPGEIARRVSRCPIVFANPPFEDFTPEDREKYRGLTHINKTTELVARVVADLPPDGVIGLVLPQGFLHGGQAEAVRRTLLEQFEIREITLFPDQVFNFSDAESCVIVARRVIAPVTKPVRFRWVREPDMAHFAQDYAVTAEQPAPPAQFLRTPKASLRIPQLDEVWEACRLLERFSSVAQIGKGLEHKTKKKLPSETVLISNNDFQGAVRGFAKLKDVGDVGIHATPREVWINVNQGVLRRPGKGVTTGIPQVVLNFARVSRGPWRLKAFLDPMGRAITSRFIALRPIKKDLPLEVLWAVCNSSFANAYSYTHTMKRQFLPRTLRQMPFPPLGLGDANRITCLVRDYVEYAEQVTPDEGPSLFTGNGHSPADVDRLLKAIDAEVLRLYDLPPRLEGRIIDLFDGMPERRRPGVPAPWSRYYPPGFPGPASYYYYLAEEYEETPRGSFPPTSSSRSFETQHSRCLTGLRFFWTWHVAVSKKGLPKSSGSLKHRCQQRRSGRWRFSLQRRKLILPLQNSVCGSGPGCLNGPPPCGTKKARRPAQG